VRRAFSEQRWKEKNFFHLCRHLACQVFSASTFRVAVQRQPLLNGAILPSWTSIRPTPARLDELQKYTWVQMEREPKRPIRVNPLIVFEPNADRMPLDGSISDTKLGVYKKQHECSLGDRDQLFILLIGL
jgi:hypothetical protein